MFTKNRKDFNVDSPFLAFQIANFFKFMHANLRVSSIFTFSNPLYCVYRNPCNSFPSANTRSIVSLLLEYSSRIPSECRISSRSEEHTSELRHANISYAVFCLKKKKK